MQIETQNALKVQEYFYMLLSQATNQLYIQSLMQNNSSHLRETLQARETPISNLNIKSDSNFIQVDDQSKSNINHINLSSNKEIINAELLTEISHWCSNNSNIISTKINNSNTGNNRNQTPENTNFESKEEKGFCCGFEGCDKKFEYKWILDRHANSHIGFKMFSCEFVGCEKAYKSKENLNLHMKNKHLGVKPYSCKYCEARFSHRNGN